MAQPSKAAPVVLTLFALPFLGGGLLFIYAQVSSRRNFKLSDLIVGVAIASFFVLFGGGLILAATKGYALLGKQAALQDAHPNSPWLWRTDWAACRAESQSQKSYIGAWILAGFANLFLFPFVLGMVPELMRHRDPRVFVVLVFISLGVVLTVRAIRATIRHERFGNSYFEFDTLPFCMGQRVSGRIHLRLETPATRGIDLRLTCVRRVVSGTGKNSSTSSITLWRADKSVPYEAVAPGPLGRAIPVDLELPGEGFHTDHTDASDQILWLLHVQADVPGVDYTDNFELPVFRTGDSPQTASALSSQPSFAGFGMATQSVDGDSASVPQPARTKVVVSPREGGTEFYFPPFRTPGRALVLLLVSVLFSGAVYLMLHSRVPGFFIALFALTDLFVILGFLHVVFGAATIFVGNGEIRSNGGLLPVPRRTPFCDVASIVPVASLQQGGNSDNSIYGIRLRTKAGKQFTLADEISSRQEARWVVSQIETLAGLKLDTHVEVDLPIGVSSQPIQVRISSARRSPQSSVVPLAVFGVFLTVGVLFFVRQGRSLSAAKARARNSRFAPAAPRPALASPRAFSGPLTDADVSRILALPAQAQAEELLERAVAHDETARGILSEHVGGWTGQLGHTEHLGQLVERAQFSTDLRVRMASVDVSLATEGWQKNERSATLLIHRADTDPQYRAWALYYLGMLAGRDVAYDRIHPVLLGYARNDPDAKARQWAVEGLRFLGKDEVLDELFTSFTEDPAMNVRDRAGCNLSDCGIFTRQQRLRMVPKLMALAAQSNLSPQMRNWCFLALREITDENQPADAVAWNRWYADHGADKLAELERLPWWRVRGDE